MLSNASAVWGKWASGSSSAPLDAVLSARARQTNPTAGLLRQTALHLSKLRGGGSVGGFPGFEPPKDDKDYRRKIQEQNYSAQDVNDWVKEINNYLEQIVKKNPGKSLERILQEQGLTPMQIEEFVDALRDGHYVAESMKEIGVNLQRVERLKSLLHVLEVPPWTY